MSEPQSAGLTSSTPVDYRNLCGRDEPSPASMMVRAGALTARIQEAEIRDVRVGDVELARRVYVAVRDENWDTAPAEISEYHLEKTDDGFSLTFVMHHAWHDINLRWKGRITGSPDGSITYAMDGVAGSSFRYNKIGLNVHHPLRECRGRPFRAMTPDGMVQGVLPRLIEPQYYVNGLPTAMFDAYDELTIDYEGGGHARFRFEGDLFEMQDHRNWTDGNFKTYGTPCQLGFPMDASRGTPFGQTLHMSLTEVSSTRRGRAAVGLDVRSATVPMPQLGLGAPSHNSPMTGAECHLLQQLHLDHLRVDVDLTGERWAEDLHRGVADAALLGAALELAATVDDNSEEQLRRLMAEVPALEAPVVRIFIFHCSKKSTPGSVVRLARSLLGDVLGVPIAGGTNAYFAEINRDRPDVDSMDGVVFSINPQVHAFDDASLVETLSAQADTVVSARAFIFELPLFVSPVTLRARFNPNATACQAGSAADELPFQVDPRQRSLFAAVWTLGSIKYLSAAGAAAVTFFETSGWRGVVETAAGPRLPDRFPSMPSDAFPVFHLLADVREGTPKIARLCDSEDPLAVEALALETSQGLRMLVGNLTLTDLDVVLRGLPRGEGTMRRLEASDAHLAAADPRRYRQSATSIGVIDATLELRLSPYEMVRIDIVMT